MGFGLYVQLLVLRQVLESLKVIDESNCKEVDLSLLAAPIVRIMEQLEEMVGLPKASRLNTGVHYGIPSLPAGARKRVSNLSLSSPVNQSKMPLLSALTALTVMKC